MRRRGLIAVAIAAIAAVPLVSGCDARLSQYIDIAPDGGGTGKQGGILGGAAGSGHLAGAGPGTGANLINIAGNVERRIGNRVHGLTSLIDGV